MSYRDNREALEEKVVELTRELAAAQERHRKEAQLLSELHANIQAVAAAVTHESPNVAPPTALVAKPPVKKPATTFIAFGAMVAAAGVAGSLFLTRRMAVPPPVAQTPPAVVAPVPPDSPLPPSNASGVLLGLSTDGPGFIVATSTTMLTRVDAKTLAAVWSVPVGNEMGWSEHETYTLNTGTRLALATSKGAFFHDDATGALAAKYLWRSETKPRGACVPGKDQLLVSMPFDGVVRIDATSGQKAQSGASCPLERAELHCGSENECGSRTYKTSELECGKYLKVAKDTFMPCEADDGTRRRFLVAMGPNNKERWRVVRSADAYNVDYMDVVADVLIAADTQSVDGYSPATGEHLWSHPRQGEKGTILGGVSHIVFGFEDTLIAIGATDGKETARLKKEK